MKSLDQVRSIGAYAPNHTAKVQNKFGTQRSILEELQAFASSVPDFRRTHKGNIRHRLADIIMLMILGRMVGHVGRADIMEFGRHNLNKLRKMGMLRNGVPSEATLCRVENGINDIDMADRMQQFAQTFLDRQLKACRIIEILCVDGNAERGTVQENGRNPDIVSAYSFNTGIILATEACQEKSNEIKAVPKLLDKIDIAGKIITADAMSMQKDIVDKIRKKGAKNSNRNCFRQIPMLRHSRKDTTISGYMGEHPNPPQKKAHARYQEATAKHGRNSVAGTRRCHRQKLSPLSKPRNEANTSTEAFQWAAYTELLKSLCLFLRHGDFAFTPNFGFLSDAGNKEIYQ